MQQSNAVESLSNINVLCTDKTGTLTSNKLVFNELIPIGKVDQAQGLAMLGDFARGAQARPIRQVKRLLPAPPGRR